MGVDPLNSKGMDRLRTPLTVHTVLIPDLNAGMILKLEKDIVMG